MYNRGNLLENNKYQWFPVNEDDEEYNIDLSEVAGRFYPMWPDHTEIMPCKTANVLQKRRAMTGEDESTLTTDFWLSLKPEETNSDESMSQSEPSDLSHSTRQTRKRSIPFDHPLDELPKKRKTEISNPEIKIDTSLPTTSNIPEVEINDYTLTNNVTSETSGCLDTISPDTPTFETCEDEMDDETKYVEVSQM
ncbi:15543_t:CDS:1 [Cetraspora pellucida]|uniref:15543_t:CDS:1 n=1 Tax=Cetraspora pellucida TaxID=1433469 RepID=A0ACA9MHL7_9GLOM|nr:15543_t:CDS:1 [Cetraspora pellucida]